MNCEDYSWPAANTFGERRAGCEAAVLIQFGMELTSAAHRGDKCGLRADGAAVDRHVEGCLVDTNTCRLALPAWEQGSKAGDVTSTTTVLAFKRATYFYLLFYQACKKKNYDMSTYPAPLPVERLILCLHASQRDHASNEGKRIAGMNDAKVKAFEGVMGRAATLAEKKELDIIDGTCGTHKIMLFAAKCREADHAVLVARLG